MSAARKDVLAANTSARKRGIFRHFTPEEIEQILVKAKNILIDQRKKIDIQLKYYIKLLYSSDHIADQYLNLQQICLRLTDIKCIKNITNYVDKINESKNIIAEAEGNIYKIEKQTQWIQNIAWYFKTKKLNNNEQFLGFCDQYFKGMNILEESLLESKLCPDIKSCRIKIQQIRFINLKDWLDFIIEEFPKNTLSSLLQLNDMFVANGMNNQQIKEYFNNQFTPEYYKNTRSNMLSSEKQILSPLNSQAFGNTCQIQRNSSSQIKQFKSGQINYRKTDSEISVQQKYSLAIIKQFSQNLKNQKHEKAFSIRVIPFWETKQ